MIKVIPNLTRDHIYVARYGSFFRRKKVKKIIEAIYKSPHKFNKNVSKPT